MQTQNFKFIELTAVTLPHNPAMPLTAAKIAATGVVVTGGATVAVVQNVGTFTAFAVCGAAAGVFYSFLSHDIKEPRQGVNARVLLGMIGGVVGPRVMEYCFKELQTYTIDPIIVIGMGFVAAWVCYSILHLVFRYGERRADKIASKIAGGIVRAAEGATGIKLDSGTRTQGEEAPK
jgi:hypothetical protein